MSNSDSNVFSCFNSNFSKSNNNVVINIGIILIMMSIFVVLNILLLSVLHLSLLFILILYVAFSVYKGPHIQIYNHTLI